MDIEICQRFFLLRWSHDFYSSIHSCGVSRLIDLQIFSHRCIPGINPSWPWWITPSVCWWSFFYYFVEDFFVHLCPSVILAWNFSFVESLSGFGIQVMLSLWCYYQFPPLCLLIFAVCIYMFIGWVYLCLQLYILAGLIPLA